MFYAKLGKFDFSGVANGGGHSVAIKEVKGVAIPKRNQIQIDFKKVTELNKWSEELIEKFQKGA